MKDIFDWGNYAEACPITKANGFNLVDTAIEFCNFCQKKGCDVADTDTWTGDAAIAREQYPELFEEFKIYMVYKVLTE